MARSWARRQSAMPGGCASAGVAAATASDGGQAESNRACRHVADRTLSRTVGGRGRPGRRGDDSVGCAAAVTRAGAADRARSAAGVSARWASPSASVDDQRQDRRRDRARQDHPRIGQRQPGHDRIAESAGADQRRQRRGADVDHRRGADAGHDRRHRQRHPDVPPDLRRGHAQRAGGLDGVAIGLAQTGHRGPDDRVERVEEERHHRRHRPDAEHRQHEGEQRDAGDGLQQARPPASPAPPSGRARRPARAPGPTATARASETPASHRWRRLIAAIAAAPLPQVGQQRFRRRCTGCARGRRIAGRSARARPARRGPPRPRPRR